MLAQIESFFERSGQQLKSRGDRDGPNQILFRPTIRKVIWEPGLSKVN